ncbi:serine/threonine protein kinase [bacterium]|nr:serine/threonine protein kinase [bacterium]
MGKKFGAYEVERKVAIGGMAEIYKAKDVSGQAVAIKKIHPSLASQEKFVQMFLDEVRIVIQLDHPNIVQLMDFGLVEGAYYFSMEWMDGKALSAVTNEQKRVNKLMPIDVALIMMMDICDGLFYAHSKEDRYKRPLNIIHRDMSPPNILVNLGGVFKITDFGIAQVRDKNLLTQPGIIRGKFSYMSPEQSLGKPLDHRSDQFSINIIFYELLTNHALFLRNSEIETLQAVRKCDIPPLKQFRNNVPAQLEAIIRRGLSLDRNKRFTNAYEMKQAIAKVYEENFPNSSRENVVNYFNQLFPDMHYTLSMHSIEEDSHYLRKARIAQAKVAKQKSFKFNPQPFTHPLSMTLLMSIGTVLLLELSLFLLSQL